MEKFEMLVNIDSISEHFEDFANEAMNNFDHDYYTFFSISNIHESMDAVFQITIYNIESNEPKGTFSFTLSRAEVIELAKVLSIMFVPLP